MALTKDQARRALAIIKNIRSQVAKANELTDEVVERDFKNGTDDIQTCEWQNFHHAIGSIGAEDDEYLQSVIDVFEACVKE